MRTRIPGSLGAGTFILAGIVFTSCLIEARGQLAITEVMPSASTQLGTNFLPALSDFWELTNFGTNAINLNGYRWNDNQGGLGGDSKPLDGLIIGTNESIIFVQSLPVTNSQQFLDWWGPVLPQNFQVVFYTGNGFAGPGDGIRLWGPNAVSDADVIDSVDFGQARLGHTFAYDPTNGLFGRFSAENVDGAFKALLRDDVGSPGFTTGPVPLQILSQPVNASVCAGIDVTFSVAAGGLPRPRYQWFHNDNAISGATSARLTVLNPQSTNAGQYQVEVSNGAAVLRSDIAMLSVSSDPTLPTIFTPFVDVSVLIGETARFSAPVCAYPPPTFQWSSDGVAMIGETSRTLVLPNCNLSQSGTLFCVEVSNSLGSTSLCARLIVTPKPKLFFTEIMARASTNCPGVEQGDWFELTNLDTKAVNLLGCRFASANGFLPNFVGAREVSMPVVLQPGQSAVFVRNLSTDQFRRWWGADALPPDLPLITFSGIGLSSSGDSLYLWSPGAEDPNDWIAAVSSASDPTTNGFSQWVREDSIADTDTYSVPGERGAFRAELCNDIGSPGYTTNPPPRMVRVARDGSGVTICWRALPGKRYQLEWKTQLTDASWTYLSEHMATDFVMTATDTTAGNARQRFYRVKEMP